MPSARTRLFLEEIATPTTRMLANVLKAEGYLFTVSTPSGGLRLASDRTRDDYVEFALDGSGDQPVVVGRIRHTRGSRTLEDERPIKPGAAPEDLSDSRCPCIPGRMRWSPGWRDRSALSRTFGRMNRHQSTK